MSAVYACTSCTWTGSAPSSTEVKSLDADQQLQFHQAPICPKCFAAARPLSSAMATFRRDLVAVTDLTPRRDPRFYPPTQAEQDARLAHLQGEIQKLRDSGVIS